MRADALERRRRILANARNLFATHGHGVALELIAEESHVGVGTFYRNFSSREDLTRAVVVELIADIVATVSTHEGHEVNAHTWTEFVHGLAGLGLGAFTDIQGVQQDDEVIKAQAEAVERLNSFVNRFTQAGVVRSDITAMDVVVAVAMFTRPQPETIAAAVPNVASYLLTAFIDFTLREDAPVIDCDASYPVDSHGDKFTHQDD